MELSLKNKFLFSFSIFIVIFSGTYLFFSNTEVGAQTFPITELYGAAWSDNIGWINFNDCEVLQSGALDCNGPEYNVQINNTTGDITGEAWSDNIGWIKFGGLSGFPAGTGTVSDNAKTNLSTGEVTGWARACAGTVPGDCSVMDSQADGWDGWISLSGEYHLSPNMSGDGGVTFDVDNDRLIGKAWGGSVIGWIDFVDVRYGPIPPDLGPIVYDLTNSTEGSVPDIEQGDTYIVSVLRTWVAGSNEYITISTPSELDGGNIKITIISNNPCEIGQKKETCSSDVQIEVDPNTNLSSYDFIATGQAGSSPETTLVQFTVIDPEPTPNISCSAEGDPWLYQPITWTASVTEPTGNENYYWRDSNGDLLCTGSEICETSYLTVGTKIAEVSVDGLIGPFTQCDPINIGARVFFKEI